MEKMEEVAVVIIGAGLAGLATGACLTRHSVPHVILEREDCIGSLWRKRSYDRLHLHLTKEVCQLPHMPHPPSAPTYLPRDDFLRYINDYASKFNLRPRLGRNIESTFFDEETKRWHVVARNMENGEMEEYIGNYMVIASGELSEPVVPKILGMESFPGEVMHSSKYKNGSEFAGKRVLVVGCGNSGMEIALDLSNYGAKPSMVVRSELQVVPKRLFSWVLHIWKFVRVPIHVLDASILFLCFFAFGDTSKYGIRRHKLGPIALFQATSKYPVLDVGTINKIRSGDIQVLPSIERVERSNIEFANGSRHQFDAVILATGYRSGVKQWLKGDDFLIGEDGMAKNKYPQHWKGKNGLYCAGLARKGILGLGSDAQLIADDINNLWRQNNVKKTD